MTHESCAKFTNHITNCKPWTPNLKQYFWLHMLLRAEQKISPYSRGIDQVPQFRGLFSNLKMIILFIFEADKQAPWGLNALWEGAELLNYKSCACNKMILTLGVGYIST